MYDPTVGEFISEDPIGFEAGDANVRRYVGNSPTNATDPSGMEPWATNEVVDILRMSDDQLANLWIRKGQIVGDKAEHWWWVYAFTGWNWPTLHVEYTADIWVDSLTAHVSPDWTSLQVAKFILKKAEGDEKLQRAIEDSTVPAQELEAEAMKRRAEEFGRGAARIGHALEAGVKVSVAMIPGGIGALLISDISGGAMGAALLDAIPLLPAGRIGRCVMNLAFKGGKEVKIVAPVVEAISKMAPEARAALKVELNAAKTAEEAAAIITRVAQSVGYRSFRALQKAIGSAGKGKVWHHIVEQSQEVRFGAEAIHTYKNVVAVSIEDNIKLNALYQTIGKISAEVTGSKTLSIREWLKTKSYDEARKFGQLAVENVRNGVWP